MEVIFDPRKDQANIRKHGISLKRAEELDFDSAHYDIDDRRDYGEVRYIAVGWLDAVLHTLVFTDSDTGVRAISLRKATRMEQEKYGDQ